LKAGESPGAHVVSAVNIALDISPFVEITKLEGRQE